MENNRVKEVGWAIVLRMESLKLIVIETAFDHLDDLPVLVYDRDLQGLFVYFEEGVRESDVQAGHSA